MEGGGKGALARAHQAAPLRGHRPNGPVPTLHFLEILKRSSATLGRLLFYIFYMRYFMQDLSLFIQHHLGLSLAFAILVALLFMVELLRLRMRAQHLTSGQL